MLGITGVTARGWYLTFNTGSPMQINITTAQLPNTPSGNTWILLALSYPENTTFNIRLDIANTTQDPFLNQTDSLSKV